MRASFAVVCVTRKAFISELSTSREQNEIEKSSEQAIEMNVLFISIIEFKILIIIRLDLEFYQNKGGVIAESYYLWLKSCAKSQS